MDSALLLTRLLLAVVFAVAGLTKLADRAGSRQAMRDFGVPARFAAPLGTLLPLAELAVAVALIPAASAWWGALGALALLLLFVAGIGFNLARGRHPDCHCFGQLHSSPAGRWTLGRNGVLAAVAGFVAWQAWDDPGASASAWLGDLSTGEAVLLVAGLLMLALLTAVVWVLLHVLGQNGRVLVRLDALEQALAGLEPRFAALGYRAAAGDVASAPPVPAPPAIESGLPVGAPAPGFSLSGLFGETLTLDALRAASKPVLLVFSNPSCGPCNALLPELGQWQREHAAELTVALLSQGAPEANRPKATEHGLTNVLLQQDREVAEAYKSLATPTAVLVRPDGTIGSSLVGGVGAIRDLLATSVGASVAAAAQPPVPVPAAVAPTVPLHAQNGNGSANGRESANDNGAALPAVLRVGDPAPSLTYPDLNGRTVSLADYRGQPTLLLFWNPDCGFCRQMLDDLRAWEVNPPQGAPKLLVVSSGTVEGNRAMGLRAPIVLDSNFEVGPVFGASGTPQAVLVDSEGRIASSLAEGSPDVLALARGESPNPTGAAAPKIGDLAPVVRLPDLNGATVDIADFRGASTVLLFWNAGCGFCQRMVEDLKAWDANPPIGAPNLVVVAAGTAESNQELRELRSPVLLDQGAGVGSAFGANGTPMAVLVDAEGRIASSVAAGAPAVLALARGEDPAAATTESDTVPPAAPKIGDPAPALVLPDLSGKTIDLARHRGTRTLLLFWNPGCGFCQRMLGDLKAWEATRPKGAPKLLVVSTGAVEENRAMGLRSPVVLDHGFAVGSAFGANGTPSAVLVDAKGKIASEVAVGAPAVFALAGVRQNQPVPVAV